MSSADENLSWNNLRKYDRCIKNIGKGGNGFVYLVEKNINSEKGRFKYVIKFVLQNSYSAFFPLELNFVRNLHYDYFVKAYGWSLKKDIELPTSIEGNGEPIPKDTECLGIAFEYIEKGDLAHSFKTEDFFDSGKFKKDEFVNTLTSILCHMICALKFLHDRNIIHSDVKPQNMYEVNIEGDTHYKLGDFGVSLIVEKKEERTLCKICGGTEFISFFFSFSP